MGHARPLSLTMASSEVEMNHDAMMNLSDEEDRVLRLPEYEKICYAQIFFNPDGCTGPGFADDYYEAARVIIERIAEGRTLAEREGTPALFLCRHYLELALKGVLFHSRWLERETKNVPRDGPVAWPFGHNLIALWNEIKQQFPVKTSHKLWDALDTEFVERCVADFHEIDPNGERFRYRLEKKSIPRDPLSLLAVSWPFLLQTTEHVHDVLGAMETYLIETYGENADWEAEMNSW